MAGKAGSGKTTFSKLLQEHFRNLGIVAHVSSFANYLKIVANYVGWNGVKDLKGRRLLQELGRIVRDYDDDFWVANLYKESFPLAGDIIIIDDWRFPNEYEYLRDRKDISVLKILIYGRQAELPGNLSKDSSENSLPFYEPEVSLYYDYAINNSPADTESASLDILKSSSLILATLIQSEYVAYEHKKEKIL